MAPEGPPMTVQVITDSAATVPATEVERLGIRVVPLRIAVGEVTACDGDLDLAELVARAPEVSTSGPTPGDFLAALETRDPAEGAVILTVSQQMGAGTFLAAQAASRVAELPTLVVDTETAAGGQGLVVLAAAETARRGATITEVVATARDVVGRVQLIATLPNLDQLARSGHVPGAAAWAARSVGMHPVLDFRRGHVRPLVPAASDAGAAKRMLDRLAASRPEGEGRLHAAVLHAMVPAAAAELAAAVGAAHPGAMVFTGPFSTAMIVHTGPGVLGLAWWWETGRQAVVRAEEAP